MRCIWALTLMSVGLKCSRITNETPLFSGIERIESSCFSTSCPVPSVDVITAIRVQPRSRK